MTNQTYIISTKETPGTPMAITNQVNMFITTGKAVGFVNFHILPVVVTGTAASIVCTVQINYYDPAVA